MPYVPDFAAFPESVTAFVATSGPDSIALAAALRSLFINTTCSDLSPWTSRFTSKSRTARFASVSADKGGADIAPATAIIPVIPSICLRFMAFLLFGQLPSHKLVEGMKAG